MRGAVRDALVGVVVPMGAVGDAGMGTGGRAVWAVLPGMGGVGGRDGADHRRCSDREGRDNSSHVHLPFVSPDGRPDNECANTPEQNAP